ncbi:type VI secretion system protein [Massilia sp. CCM 9210]|uniref:type VI secretion system protein n=1 Tax=Massilia scottii TaxID=3057166 RepID=UPI0027964B14|nr:type VI secretion system protein [Massilia sp. CCM 9210]MDQ1812077.1 type VI secretion system protein [Massilia sp. CCM 9210]
MDPLYIAIIVAAVLVGLLAARMVWTASKAKPPAACCDHTPGADVAQVPAEARAPWRERLRDTFDYLRARREWRYQTPWVMLLGERGAGKSSLTASVRAEHRQLPDPRQSELADALGHEHVRFCFLRQGVLIDVDGQLPNATPDFKRQRGEATKWRRLLDKIDAMRPERALDALMVVVSAATLAGAAAEQRRLLAENVYRQLTTVHDRFDFALPVYVVVTGADAIPGFAAFWRTQPNSRPGMFGWSLPAQAASETPAQWVDQVFDGLGERLKALQIAAAASQDYIADADRFFLFPRHFLALRAPMKHWLSVVFLADAWRAGFLCRGVYFTGCLDADAGRPGELCEAVHFVDDLLTKKVLAEPHLARPTRDGIWSRNKLIRTLQRAGLVLSVGGLVWLGYGAWQLHRQIATLSYAEELVRQTSATPEPGQSCMDRARVFDLAERVARIGGDLRYLSMPLSYMVPKAGAISSSLIANHALEVVILPAIACRLGLKAKQLVAVNSRLSAGDPAAVKVKAGPQTLEQAQLTLLTQLTNIHALETNLLRLKNISTSQSVKGADRLQEQFIGLLEYSYEANAPSSLRDAGSALSNALAIVGYSDSPPLPPEMHEFLERQLGELDAALWKTLERETAAGQGLLAELEKTEAPAADSIRRFAAWLVWVKDAWYGSTPTRNPCETIRLALNDHVSALIRDHHYSSKLSAIPGHFSAAACYRPLINKLTALRVAPNDTIFFLEKDVLKVEPALVPELQGMASLVELEFMQAPDSPTFYCQPGLGGWRPEKLVQASNYIREYQAFARNRGLPGGGAGRARQPLYDKLARRQLMSVLNQSMRDAQLASQSASPLQRASLSLDASALPDQMLSQESADFAKAVDPMLGMLRTFAQAGFADDIKPIELCARDYAASNLGRIEQLVGSTRLYRPDADGSAAPFFNLGPLPVTKDYLARQVARTGVLTGYAAPFLALLQNTEPHNDAQRPRGQTADYWNNSIAELHRYTRAQEQNGQVGHLHDLFLKTLAGMDAAGCGKTLAAYRPAEPGNDLFSEHRQQLEARARWHCDDRGHARGYEMVEALAARFRRELQGRYPFAALDAADAQPATVRRFFADYAQERGALHQMLDGLSGAQWRDTRHFVGELDAASDFFNATLGAGDGGQAVKLDITFRALPASSAGSEEIVNWSLASGARTISYPNRLGPFEWSIGQPIVLDLNWANLSRWRPIDEREQRDLHTEGGTASFSASGEWALLRMIERHRARATPSAGGALEPGRLFLEFGIPVAAVNAGAGTTPTGRARVYLSLTMSGIDAKTQAPVPVRLPASFPRHAPPFPSNSQQTARSSHG